MNPQPNPLFRRGLMALLWLWFGALLTVNMPGHLTADSLIQIAEGRSGIVNSWNPLFSSWVFGSIANLTGGAEAIVMVSSLLLMGSVWALVGTSSRGHLWALIPAAALMATPILMTYPGVVWKDVWFAHCAALGFGLVMLRARGAPAWIEVPALLLLAMAMLSRQTGILVCAVAVLALTLAAAVAKVPAGGGGRAASTTMASTLATTIATTLSRVKAGALLRLVLGFGLRMLALILIAMTLNAWAQASMRQINTGSVGTGFRLVAIFDISGMLQRQPQAELQRLRREGFDMAAWEQASRQTFSAERIDTLVHPPLTGPRHLDDGLLLHQWADLVLQHPLSYVQHRLETFAWFNGLRNQARCLPIHVGIEPVVLAEPAGIRPVASRWSGMLYQYSRLFVDTPYFAPAAWSVLSLLVLAAYLWMGQWRHPMAWMQVAGLLYSSSYLMAGLSCDFRYSYFPVLAASLGLMRVCADGLSRSRPEHA